MEILGERVLNKIKRGMYEVGGEEGNSVAIRRAPRRYAEIMNYLKWLKRICLAILPGTHMCRRSAGIIIFLSFIINRGVSIHIPFHIFKLQGHPNFDAIGEFHDCHLYYMMSGLCIMIIE